MAIKITISDKVGFKVKGASNDIDGTEQDFDFGLTAKRLSESALNDIQSTLIADAAKTGNHSAVISRLADHIITNWGNDVRDDAGSPIPYTPESFTALCQAYKGLGLLIWHTYLANVGAKAKN